MDGYRELVQYLIETRALKTQRIISAFEAIDRKDFVRAEYLADAYYDGPLPIGCGQTISQPTVVAMMLEWLEPEPGNKILDIGSGSCWTTALLAKCVTKSGQVIGLERIPELVEFGRENLKNHSLAQADNRLAGDALGYPGKKFDRIMVSAAAQSLPKELIAQLKTGGILVVPVLSSILIIKKISDTDYEENESYGFSFVPLL
ncbi:protein-L-isoaspartate O-methyltransferase [Candidatus Margulisiibacteriota bacterium]